MPLFVALVTLIVAFLRFGYVYGSGDQDELIPSVLHLLDGTLFTQDWLVQTVASGINVRTFFLWLVALPSLVVPPWLAVFVLWVGVFVALAWGVYGLAYELVRDRLAAALAVFVALAVTVKWTLGANSLAYDALVPEGVAWALAVPAISSFLQRRWLVAGALLGLAAWFHLLAGAQTALVLGVVGFARAVAHADLAGTRFRADVLDLARFGGVFVLVALPILIPVVLDQFAAEVPGTVPAFYIHAQFRNPFHHLFSAFEMAHHLRFWPLVGLGLASGAFLARRGVLRHGRALVVAGLLIALLCTLAILFVEVVPVAFVAKLQFFKLTVLVSLVASVLCSGALVLLLPDALRRWGERLLGWQYAGLGLALALCVLVGLLALRGDGRPGALLHPLRHLDTPLGEVERWARAETPTEALFAIPPSVSTFRTGARRAVVANYAGFVFTDRAMDTWFTRLMDVAPIAPPPTGLGVKPVLDAAYHRQPAAAWLQLRSSYGLDFVVAEKPTALPFAVAFENAAWVVYALAEGQP